jgi:hypothetical protein
MLRPFLNNKKMLGSCHRHLQIKRFEEDTPILKHCQTILKELTECLELHWYVLTRPPLTTRRDPLIDCSQSFEKLNRYECPTLNKDAAWLGPLWKLFSVRFLLDTMGTNSLFMVICTATWAWVHDSVASGAQLRFTLHL